MEIHVMAKSYDTYGAHTTLSAIGGFLLRDAPSFGDAVRKIDITLYFPDSGPAKESLEHLLELHTTYRAKLPKIVYRRAKASVEIDVASELMDGRAFEPSPRLSLPLFERGVDEVCRALSLMKGRLKSSDAFDVAAFLSHCEKARERIPSSEDDLQVIDAELQAVHEARRAAMSPWDKLAIDWEDFHPAARELLDDPFYWEQANDFSPNGNDTGADLLESYRDWLRKHKDGRAIEFLQRLAKVWGYPNFDGMDEEIRDEAAVGLAFADIKLRATCDEQARNLAVEAITRQRTQAQSAREWSHREERLKTLDMIEARLHYLGRTEK